MTLTTDYQAVGTVTLYHASGTGWSCDYNATLYAKYTRTDSQYLNNKSTIHSFIRVTISQSSSSYTLTASNRTFTYTGASGTSINYGYGTWIGGNYYDYMQESWEVTHNDDGAKTISLGFTASSALYSGITLNQQTLTLPTIARAATPVINSNVTMGNNLSGSLSPYSSNFKYTLVASRNSTSITLATKASGIQTFSYASRSYNFYNFLGASEKRATITLTCTTYSGNTTIGTKSTTFVLYANSSDVPTVSINSTDTGKTIYDTTKTTLDLTGSNKRIINNWNKISSTWTALSNYGATISQVKINNTTVTTSPKTTNNVSGSITIKATDSRGYSKTLTETGLTFIPYETPSIVPTIKRNSSTDGLVNLTYQGIFYNTNFGNESNALTLQWYVREKGNSSYTRGTTTLTYTIQSDNKSYKQTTSIRLSNPLDTTEGKFDYTKAYEFKFIAIDKITSYTISEVVLTKGIPNFVVFKDKIMANGKVINEKNVISVGLQTDHTLTTNSAENLNMSAVWTIGNKLSVSNGGILISGGVTRILVSAIANFSTVVEADQIYQIDIFKNTALQSVAYFRTNGTLSNQGVVLPPKIVGVTDGDIIYLAVRTRGSVTGAVVEGATTQTYMTAEVIY